MIVSDERLRPWLEQIIGHELRDCSQFIGRVKDGQAVACAGFSNYTGHDIEVTVAALPGGFSRQLVDALWQYVFNQLHCVRCTLRTKATNVRAQRCAERMGFVREGVLRLGCKTEDSFIYGLLRDDHGKQRPKAADPARSRHDPRAAEPVQPDEQ